MFESLKKFWNDTLEIPEARWMVWGSILLVLTLFAVYFAKMFRDMAVGSGGSSSEILPDLDKLHTEGKLDETEYKKLRSTLAEQRNQIVKHETKDNH